MAKWRPRLSLKQLAQFESDKRVQLLVGPKYSGKTYSLYHSVLYHLWNLPVARFGIISRTTRAGTTGIWPNIIGAAFNEWRDAGICTEDYDFGWTKPPHQDSVTKINRAVLRNKFGGDSELLLFPIDRAEDAEEKMFSTEFSALWLSEAQYYENRQIFDTCRAQLRLLGSRFEDQRLFIDMNPAEQGTSHWAYQTFYRERHLKPEEFPKEWDDFTREAVLEFQRNSAVFEFTLDDNTFADQRQLNNIRATYASDPKKYARFVRGEWMDTTEDALVLSSVFQPNLHVVGKADAPNPDDWEVIAPSNGPAVERLGGKVLLLDGWDPGDTNHAWVCMQPWTDENGIEGFDILDELVVLKGSMTIDAFTKEVLAKRKALADFAGFPITFTSFADGSTERFRAQISSDGTTPREEHTDAAIITAASAGDIRLIGSAEVKKPGWQKRRVDLIRTLLSEKRLRISAHCTHTIDMIQRLRRDMGERAKTYLEPQQECKHIFDALSYAVSMRMLDVLMDEGVPRTRKRRASMIASR